VAVLDNPLIVRASEDLSRVFASESLIQSQDARDDFLGDDECIIDQADFAEANVAGLAIVALKALAKVLDDCPMPTSDARAIGLDAFEYLQGNLMRRQRQLGL